MNWNSDTGKSLKISLVLHGAVFLLVVAAGIVSSIFHKPEPPVHVFQLQGIKGQQHIGAPGRMAGDRKKERTDKPTTSASSPLNLPKLDQRTPSPIEDAAEAPTPAKPTPQKTAKAAAKPSKTAAAKPTKPTTKKAVANAKPVSAKSAKQQTISYSDFAKQHKISSSSGSSKSASKKKKTSSGASGINTASIVKDMKNNLAWGDGGDGGGGLQGGAGMTSGDMDALADYFARVRALIDSNFDEPKGVMQQVSALVQFTILANGTVTGVSIVNSSGNDTFDAAAVAAVRGLGRLDPPPGNMAYTRKIEFVGKRNN